MEQSLYIVRLWGSPFYMHNLSKHFEFFKNALLAENTEELLTKYANKYHYMYFKDETLHIEDPSPIRLAYYYTMSINLQAYDSILTYTNGSLYQNMNVDIIPYALEILENWGASEKFIDEFINHRLSNQKLENLNVLNSTLNVKMDNIELNSNEQYIFYVKNIEYGIEKIEEIDNDWEITRRQYYKYYDIFKLNYCDSDKEKLIIRYIDSPNTDTKGFLTIIYDNDGKIISQSMDNDDFFSKDYFHRVIIKLFNNGVWLNRIGSNNTHGIKIPIDVFSKNSYKVEITEKKIEWNYINFNDLYLFEKEEPETYYNYCCHWNYDD
jgi:hypothetical protein